MSSITFFSGPCGCGKSTLANAYARYVVDQGICKQVYVIHGDDFHAGFVETRERIGSAGEPFFYWPDILQFNWECMIAVAEKVLAKGVDVVFMSLRTSCRWCSRWPAVIMRTCTMLC